MNSYILITLCLISWAVTLIKLRGLFVSPAQRKAQDKNTLNLWATLLFFSITLTFMVDEFAVLLNSYTFPNMALLVTRFAFLASQYFAVVAILDGIGAPANQRTIRWIRVILGLLCATLLLIYVGFLSKIPDQILESSPYLSVVIFKLLSYPFGILLCLIIIRNVVVHLPAKELALMRLRAMTIIWCVSTAMVYIFIRMLIYTGFFWPTLLPNWLFPLSHLLLLCATILFFATLQSNKIYTHFVLLSRCIESWHIFHDLRHLAKHMLLFCPPVGLPPNNPGFLIFLFNPDYYLYRAIISILDSKAMLTGLIAKDSATWSKAHFEEAIRINTALQTANPSNDFADIVETYRRVSRDLFASQT